MMMNNLEALNVLKSRYLVNQHLIEKPQSDFDRFIEEENEALLIAIEALRKEVNKNVR